MIHVAGLVRKFGDVTAVDDVSFDVAQGEIFAFLGPNGAGKTTTIKMVTTLLTPTAGTVEIDGLNVRTQGNEARKRFGIVFQDPSATFGKKTKCSTQAVPFRGGPNARWRSPAAIQVFLRAQKRLLP